MVRAVIGGPQSNRVVGNIKYIRDGVMERHADTSQCYGNPEAAFKIFHVSK